MRKLFLLAFSPLIIGSLWLMTYYGITSNDLGEKVFAVLALTAFHFNGETLRIRLNDEFLHLKWYIIKI